MDDSERSLLGHSLLQPNAETQHLERTFNPPGSLLSTLIDHLSCRQLVIQGPSKSGRSSLLMDLACDLAARAPCWCVGDRPCCCLAVVLFLPLAQEEFPLHCQQQPGEKLRSFDKQTLKRIQIRRIANPRDIQQQLWKIQGAGWHEQPYALLLDGLDCITSCAQEEPQSPTPIQRRARQSLLMATLIDTANCLTKQKRNQVATQPAVMTAVTSSIPICPLSFCITSSAKSLWAELTLDAGQTTSPFIRNSDEVVASHWVVQHGNQCVARYVVLHDLEGERRILWDVNLEKLAIKESVVR
ncbi:hypothetical protein FisN_12Hh350 [Fistulifera solaris]|uniref:Uncharacterized protein n=1 Tax=Fistulifera solaris TaxID=1519565 RepID=A0A1Z5KCB5_FISSO|nr:hypothetical protein FisN_12Hh350 [Fistulifera solaris]|eukprot:GAX23772.1 hypothetical protein FisN_12Hh350 [Fistulifera solaris]